MDFSRREMLLLAAGALLSPVLAEGAPAKTKEPVLKIGCLDPMSGPAALPFNESVWGTDLAARYINEHGGINGVRIQVLHADTKYDPGLAMAAYKKYIEVDKVMAVTSWSSGESALFKPMAARDKVVVWGIASPLAMWPAQGNYVFSDFAGYAIFYESYLKWYLKERWKQGKPMRVAGAFLDMPAGKDAEVALKNACKMTGQEYVGSAWVPITATDTTTQVVALKSFKADTIIMFQVGVAFIALMRDANRLGLTKETQLFTHFYIGAPYVVEAAGADAWKGVLGYVNWAVFSDETEAVKIAKEYITKYKPDWGSVETIQERICPWNFFRNWTLVFVLAEAYRRAMEKVGAEKVNGEALRDALITIKNFNAKGAAPEITFRPDRRIGSVEKAQRIVEVVPGKTYVRPVSDWIGLDRELTPEEKTVEYWTKYPK